MLLRFSPIDADHYAVIRNGQPIAEIHTRPSIKAAPGRRLTAMEKSSIQAFMDLDAKPKRPRK